MHKARIWPQAIYNSQLIQFPKESHKIKNNFAFILSDPRVYLIKIVI